MRSSCQKRVSKKVSYASSDGGASVMFRRNAISAIMQLNSKSIYRENREIKSHKIFRDQRSQLSNFNSGWDPCRCAEKEIEGSRNVEVFWSTVTEREAQSLWFLHLYSERSGTSLAAGAIVFYSFQSTLLSVSEPLQPYHISNESTIIWFEFLSYIRTSWNKRVFHGERFPIPWTKHLCSDWRHRQTLDTYAFRFLCL